MDLLHKSVFTEPFILTRRAVQDVAKAVGKVQQLFLPQDLNSMMYGLEVWPEGIASQPFSLTPGAPLERVLINLQAGSVTWGTNSWQLAQIDGMALFTALQQTLSNRGYTGLLSYPGFSEEETAYQPDNARHLANLLWWGHGVLSVTQNAIAGAEKAPLLIYPHHFDEAVQWDQTDEQSYTFGFSPGDETIKDPYFYVTADPETNNFVQRTVPSPAYWQSEGFNGAVMRLQDFWNADDVTARARDFIVHLLSAS